VNTADVAALVTAGLAAAVINDVPVVDPGTPTSTLPAVVLAPGPDRLEAGNRSIRHGLNVTAVVPRNNQPDQYVRLQEIAGAVLRGLLPSSVRLEPVDIEFVVSGGGDTGEPAAMSRVIPVSFTGDVDLC
jgi:hypothetical protein